MSKYKNKDGIELNFGNMTKEGRNGSGVTLIQEVITETIKILSRDGHSHKSQVLGIDNTTEAINFLKENFDIKDNEI